MYPLGVSAVSLGLFGLSVLVTGHKKVQVSRVLVRLVRYRRLQVHRQEKPLITNLLPGVLGIH